MKILKSVIAVAALAAAAEIFAQQPQNSDPVPQHRQVVNLDEADGVRPRTKGESAQGMAVWKNRIYALYHGGDCVVYDFKRCRTAGEFVVEAARGTHCNNASFGVEYAGRKSECPLLYISECGGERRCFVVDISARGARQVATIRFGGSGIVSYCDWFVDRENRHLYTFGKNTEAGVTIRRFALPTMAEMEAAGGDLTLGDSDILWESKYPKDYFIITQGSCITGGRIVLPTGYPGKGGCFIHVLDADSGRRIERYCIDDIGREPEGVCPVGDEIWVLFGWKASSGRVMAFDLPECR